MGSSLSPDPGILPLFPDAQPGTTSVTNVELRSQIPRNSPLVNTTTVEEPTRRMINPDDTWVRLETAPLPQFLAGLAINTAMEYLDRWPTRSRVDIPSDIEPVIKHRMLSSLPEGSLDTPTDERLFRTLNEALTFVEKTGAKKDCPRALAVHALLCPTKGRSGRPTAPIQLGGAIVCGLLITKTINRKLVLDGGRFWGSGPPG